MRSERFALVIASPFRRLLFRCGATELADGIGFANIAMGVFGFAEIIRNLELPAESRDIVQAKVLRSLPRVARWSVPVLKDRGAAQVAADTTRDVMWRGAGVIRTAAGLRGAREALEDIERRLPTGATEEENLVQTARLIVEGAIRRKESRGGHYRSDFPDALLSAVATTISLSEALDAARNVFETGSLSVGSAQP